MINDHPCRRPPPPLRHNHRPPHPRAAGGPHNLAVREPSESAMRAISRDAATRINVSITQSISHLHTMNALRPAASALRLCSRPRVRTRTAHTAAIDPDRENAQAGPSRPRIRPDADYRFPKTSKRGGPPDPYEVMALTRGASAADIKAKCE